MAIAPFDRWPEVDDRYKVKFLVSGKGGIVALLPETFSEEVSSEWSAALAGIAPFIRAFTTATQLGKDVAKKFEGVSQESINETIRPRILDNRYWMGSSPLTISGMKLVFVGRSSAYDDVVKPARLLQSLALPRVWGGGEFFKIPHSIEIVIGRMLRLHDAVLPSVSIEWSSYLDARGHPQFCTVSLSIQTRQVYVIEGEKDGEPKEGSVLGFKKFTARDAIGGLL